MLKVKPQLSYLATDGKELNSVAANIPVQHTGSSTKNHIPLSFIDLSQD